MKFSIIVPTYNAESSIENTLQSVQNQIYQNFEVIIIDDGSTDSTAHICKKFVSSDKRFRYFFHENKGVSASRNRGINLASGDFLFFLDSDDTYDKAFLSEFKKAIHDNPDFDNYWCGLKFLSLNSSVVRDITYNEQYSNNLISNRSNIMELYERLLVASPCNKAYRTSTIQKYSLTMPNDFSLGEDLIFNYMYLDVAKSDIYIIDLPLYNVYRAQDGSLDTKYRSNLADIFSALDNTMSHYFTKWELPPEHLCKLHNVIFFRQIKILYNTYHHENAGTNKEKRKYNNKILKSKKFLDAMRFSDCYIHPLYRIAYKSGKWQFVQFLDKLQLIKSKLLKKKR